LLLDVGLEVLVAELLVDVELLVGAWLLVAATELVAGAGLEPEELPPPPPQAEVAANRPDKITRFIIFIVLESLAYSRKHQ
jgi:hypothetical protein